MFIKSDIRKVTIALEKPCAHDAYVRLGLAGIMQFARIQAGDALKAAQIASEEERTRNIIAGSAFVLNFLQIEAADAVISKKKPDMDADAAFVSRAKKEAERLQGLDNKIQQEIAQIAQQLEYAEALGKMGIDPGAVKGARLVQVVFGRVTDAVPEAQAQGRVTLALADHYVLGAALPEAAPQMIEYLKQFGFVDKTDEVSGTPLENLRDRESGLKRELDELQKEIDGFRKKTGPELRRLFQIYAGYEEVVRAMRLAGSSEEVTFITGWIDARDNIKLRAILKEVCGDLFMISSERDPHAPVRLMNSRLFKPFELLVRTMGMPANSEIDPTPLAAVSFVIIFGLMFGDLGQGAVIAVCGLSLKFYAGRKGHRENLNQAGGILIACGISAALCGILYGSMFSSEHLIPALWMNPAENIMGLFFVTILLGAVLIMVGLCVNIVNAVINAEYSEAFLGKYGAAILIPYGAAVFMAMRYAIRPQAPAAWEIGAFIVLPFALFCLRGVLQPVFFHSEWPHDAAEYVAETIIGVVEIGLGMFANTISFIRVGAFALAHTGLGIVTFTLAGMADPALKTPAAVVILVFGNIFIIGFEGLIVMIQSMRLEYYEFFSKFFKGNGLVFSPFVLKTKRSEV